MPNNLSKRKNNYHIPKQKIHFLIMRSYFSDRRVNRIGRHEYRSKWIIYQQLHTRECNYIWFREERCLFHPTQLRADGNMRTILAEKGNARETSYGSLRLHRRTLSEFVRNRSARDVWTLYADRGPILERNSKLSWTRPLT